MNNDENEELLQPSISLCLKAVLCSVVQMGVLHPICSRNGCLGSNAVALLDERTYPFIVDLFKIIP